MKHQFIDAHRSEFRLIKMCQVLEVSRSGYHSWKNRSSSERKISNQSLLEKIKAVYKENEGIYGSPKITEELNAQGIKCSKNRVAKIMKENGIKSKIKRKFKKTTDSEHNLEVAPNIYAEVKSNISAPNQVWLSDITYIWTKEGWLYLAVILDAFTHGVIGWSMSNRITRQLVINAFLMAVYHKNPGQNVIFDSVKKYMKKRFGHSIVITISNAAHTLYKMMIF